MKKLTHVYSTCTRGYMLLHYLETVMEIALSNNSVADMKAALSDYVSGFTGFSGVKIRFNGWVIEIDCGYGPLLKYDLKNYKEVFGKIKTIGFTEKDMRVIGRAVGRIISRLKAIYAKRK